MLFRLVQLLVLLLPLAPDVRLSQLLFSSQWRKDLLTALLQPTLLLETDREYLVRRLQLSLQPR